MAEEIITSTNADTVTDHEYNAQTGKGSADIGRCAAGARAEGRHLVKGASYAGRDHVDQRFADGK